MLPILSTIDSQPVTSLDQGYYAPGWLAGVGIYYKGAIGKK